MPMPMHMHMHTPVRHGSSRHGCNPIHERLRPYPREAATLRTRGCHPATPCVCPRCVMALVTATTWPTRAAKASKKVVKGSKKK
eukprot:scaffold105676_cov51-Phaeocystis_antarctica.AAC.3